MLCDLGLTESASPHTHQQQGRQTLQGVHLKEATFFLCFLSVWVEVEHLAAGSVAGPGASFRLGLPEEHIAGSGLESFILLSTKHWL